MNESLPFTYDEVREIVDTYEGIPDLNNLVKPKGMRFNAPSEFRAVKDGDYFIDTGGYILPATRDGGLEHKRLIVKPMELEYEYVTDGIPRFAKEGELIADGGVRIKEFCAIEYADRPRLIFTRREKVYDNA